LADLTGNKATAGLAVKVFEFHKPLTIGSEIIISDYKKTKWDASSSVIPV
jgi:hypothetical protein